MESPKRFQVSPFFETNFGLFITYSFTNFITYTRRSCRIEFVKWWFMKSPKRLLTFADMHPPLFELNFGLFITHSFKNYILQSFQEYNFCLIWMIHAQITTLIVKRPCRSWHTWKIEIHYLDFKLINICTLF